MKELSIEEKAKAYDEAKIRMSKAYNDNRCTIGFMNEIFPELAESKDEKVKKSLIRLVKAFYDVNFPTPEGFTKEQLLSWIEEQDEQKPLIIPKFRIGDIITPNGKKEYYTITDIVDGWYEFKEKHVNGGIPIHYQFGWELVEHKLAEWSEEDEKKRKFLIKGLEDRMGFGWASDPFSREELINLLKSLKDRFTWKPSDEQMDALYTYIYNPQYFNSPDPRMELVESVYKDLKKLRE